MAGKGDKPRPVNKKNYDKNFEMINWKSNQKILNIVKKNRNKIVISYK